MARDGEGLGACRPKRLLSLALKHWTDDETSKWYRKEQQVPYNQRMWVANEFLELLVQFLAPFGAAATSHSITDLFDSSFSYKGDEAAFIAAYPYAEGKGVVAKLVQDIRAKQVARKGKTIQRRKRKAHALDD